MGGNWNLLEDYKQWDERAFEPLTVERYASWVRAFVRSGGKIAYATDGSFPSSRFLLAKRDFAVAGECGSNAREILVPAGIRFLGGDMGHNVLYFEPGNVRSAQGRVCVFSNPEFADIPGAREALAQRRAEVAAFNARFDVQD